LGGALYALATVFFIFPHVLIPGGTSGISVILSRFLSGSPGTIISVLNFGLLILALIILGKEMALKTLVGSSVTTVFITLFEWLGGGATPVSQPFVSAVIGATVIALASGVMFYVDSSSGGTDIIALIIKKFSSIDIGRALFITDILIVVVGGILSGLTVELCSVAGLVIKSVGIDLIIKIITILKNKGKVKDTKDER
jgi:uncharacterized membrane-anchored protein YitT (DUF2179 family)